jgi:hypothetical protein
MPQRTASRRPSAVIPPRLRGKSGALVILASHASGSKISERLSRNEKDRIQFFTRSLDHLGAIE